MAVASTQKQAPEQFCMRNIDSKSTLGDRNASRIKGPLFETGSIAIGGHRGMGMNFEAEGGISAVRENTCASFLQAAASGATFIEFDVQVTADGVPILWHDDLVRRRLADSSVVSSPVAALTLAEFQDIYEQSRAETPLVRQFYSRTGALSGLRDWRCQTDDKLPTLAEVFAAVPEHVGFDIEVKMAVPDTVEQTPAAEVDRCVGPILKCISYARSSQRKTMFSSFDPEICRALRERQSSVAVLLLFCGISVHADQRRNSTAMALEFAVRHQLQGLVMETGTLRKQEGTATTARTQGLQLMTYGLGNNDPKWVAHQYLQLGVSAAIVDDVAAVVSYLDTLPIISQLATSDKQHMLSMGSSFPIQHRRKAVAA